jgi:peptidoglycan/LPS O-acetylase OafA/YrhL
VLGFDYYPLQSLAEWVQAVTLTQNFTGIAYEQGRGVQQAWSLAIEVDFYVFVPAFAALVTVGAGRMGVGATRRRWWWGVGAVFVVGAVWQLIARETLVPLFMLPNYFPAFGSGMALALLSVDMPARLAPITARLGAARGMLGVAAVGVLGLRAWVFTAPEGFAAKQGPEAQLWFTLFAVLVVAPLVWSLDRPGLLARRVPAALGTVSYGVFLWHLAMLQSWSPVDFGFGEDLRFNPVVRGLLFGALSLAVATVSWFLVERPILRWSHRRSA